MNGEVKTPVFVGILVVILLIVGFFAWRQFGPSGGITSAAQAGLGKPMHPGEIPGKQGAVQAPIAAPGAH